MLRSRGKYLILSRSILLKLFCFTVLLLSINVFYCENQDPYSKAKQYEKKASSLIVSDRIDSAKQYVEKIEQLFKSEKDSIFYYKAKVLEGHMMVRGMKIEDGLLHLLEAADYYKRKGLVNDYYSTQNEIALADYFLFRKDKSVEIFKEVLEHESEVDEDVFTRAKHGLGAILFEYTIARKPINKEKFSEAVRYIKEAAELNIKAGNWDDVAINYGILSEAYIQTGQLDSAEYFIKESIRIAHEDGNTEQEAFDLIKLSNIYHRKKNYSESDRLIMEAEKIYTESNNKEKQAYVYQYMGKHYSERGEFEKAYEASLKMFKANRSIFDKKLAEGISEMEVKYDTEKKEKELLSSKLKLAQQEQKNTQLSLANEQRLIWLILIAGLSILIMIIVFFMIRNLRKKREHDLKEFHLKEQIAAEKAEKQIAEEKVRVSRELHDNIGSRITFLISSMDNLTYRKIDDDSKQKLIDLAEFGRSTMSDLRNTVWAMKMENGKVADLENRIVGLKQFLNTDFEVKTEVDRNMRLSAIQLLNMYRIVQEATQNAVKYSSCSSIEVKLDLDSDQNLILSIIDDGIGFNVEAIKYGNGLRNMKHRCEECGGEFSIKSDPNSGTSIVCTLLSSKSLFN